DRPQHTEETGDKSESKKAKKHKKKKSKSSEDKSIPIPSIQPSVETQPKEKTDISPSTILPEPRPEVQEPPIDDAQQQGPPLNLESANSCMGDDNAKVKKTYSIFNF
ncbi:hypothetical protein A2U01_0061546, partial [Trifolium medium]|nr:hypothetical protein [Trifolium medium]